MAGDGKGVKGGKVGKGGKEGKEGSGQRDAPAPLQVRTCLAILVLGVVHNGQEQLRHKMEGKNTAMFYHN